jgi:hypothetical protein
MSHGRKMVTAGTLHHKEIDPETGTVTLFAKVTDGPQDAIGRTMELIVGADEVLGLLAALAIRPEWAVAFDAAARDEAVQEAARNGTYYMNHSERVKRVLSAMQDAVRKARAS